VKIEMLLVFRLLVFKLLACTLGGMRRSASPHHAPYFILRAHRPDWPIIRPKAHRPAQTLSDSVAIRMKNQKIPFSKFVNVAQANGFEWIELHLWIHLFRCRVLGQDLKISLGGVPVIKLPPQKVRQLLAFQFLVPVPSGMPVAELEQDLHNS
jgi:hypothetical protein